LPWFSLLPPSPNPSLIVNIARLTARRAHRFLTDDYDAKLPERLSDAALNRVQECRR
jgi:hypothetical protein